MQLNLFNSGTIQLNALGIAINDAKINDNKVFSLADLQLQEIA